MATDINAFYTKEYTDVVSMLAQQKKSRFERGAIAQACSGETHNLVNYVGDSTVMERTTRGEAKVIADKNHTLRWVEAVDYFTESDIVDSIDILKTKIEPSGSYTASQVAAFNRKKDDVFISKIHGSALSGKGGTSTTAWDTANDIAAAAFSITNIKAAIQRLQENEVILDDGEEELFMAITPKQYNIFSSLSEVANKDWGNTYFDKGKLMIDSWLGINIIVSNRLIDSAGSISTTASTTREIPMWAKSGMRFGIWKDLYGTVTDDPNRANEPKQITTYGTFGVARVEENKVIKIIVDETA